MVKILLPYFAHFFRVWNGPAADVHSLLTGILAFPDSMQLFIVQFSNTSLPKPWPVDCSSSV